MRLRGLNGLNGLHGLHGLHGLRLAGADSCSAASSPITSIYPPASGRA